MHWNLFTAILLLFALNSALALEYPYSDYVKSVAKVALSQNRNASTWTGGATYNTPAGGQIARFWHDVDSDGKEDLFLMSSLNFPYASVYRKTNNADGYEKITETAIILEFYFFSKPSDVGEIFTTIYQIRGFARIAQNVFGNGGGFRIDDEIVEGTQANSINPADYGEKTTPDGVQKISMQELVLSDRPKWRAADINVGLLAQAYEIPKLTMPKVEAFTPSFVLKKLNSLGLENNPVTLP